MAVAAWELEGEVARQRTLRVVTSKRRDGGGTTAAQQLDRAAARRMPSAAVYRRRRAALMVIAAVAAVLWHALGPTSTATSNAVAADASPAPPVTIVVAPGDTVWDLARAHVAPDENLHVYVAEVLAHNRVAAASLRPGTVLELPRH